MVVEFVLLVLFQTRLMCVANGLCPLMPGSVVSWSLRGGKSVQLFLWMRLAKTRAYLGRTMGSARIATAALSHACHGLTSAAIHLVGIRSRLSQTFRDVDTRLCRIVLIHTPAYNRTRSPETVRAYRTPGLLVQLKLPPFRHPMLGDSSV